MAYITVTNSFTTGAVLASGDMNTNFTDIINGLSDGTKDLNLERAEIRGATTIYGNTTLGTSSADNIYFYAKLETDLSIDNQDLGSTTKPFASLYLNNSATDGGTIYFNGGTTSYIKSDSDGNILTIEGFSTGIEITEDGYLRLGASSNMEFAISSDNVEIRNRTDGGKVDFYTNYSGTDTKNASTHRSTYPYFETIQRKENINVIINGDMRIDQRDKYTSGGTVTMIRPSEFISDRFEYLSLGASSYKKYIDSDFPYAPTLFPRYAGCYVNIPRTTPLSTEYQVIQQVIEGYFIDPYMHKTLTLSFWVRCSETGDYAIAFQNKGAGTNLPTSADRSYVTEYTINTADTWEYKEVQIPLSTVSGGTWGTTNDIGLKVMWVLLGGSNFNTTADTWQNGAYLNTTTSTNHAATANNDFLLTGVQLTPTPFGMPFQHRFIDEEINLCQRYFEKTYNLEDGIGSATTAGSKWSTAREDTYLYNGLTYELKSRKHDTPTLTAYSPVTGVINYASEDGGGSYYLDTSGDTKSNQTVVSMKGDSTFTEGSVVGVQYAISSEF